MKKRILFVFIVAFTTIVLSLGVLYIHVRADWLAKYQVDTDIKGYRLSHPAPYANSPYWSVAFVLEYDKLSAHLNQWGYFEYNDFHGTYYNTDNGLRRTVGQPLVYAHTIWLFGNSGTLDPYVPDAYTMASQLQALLPHQRVMNMGMGGAHVNAELLSLQHTHIRPGDAVIFIDGGMDMQDNTPIDRYWKTVNSAHEYALARGASFQHYIQPCYDMAFEQPLTGPRFTVPVSMFVDHGCHMQEHGDSIVAQTLFDVLTTF